MPQVVQLEVKQTVGTFSAAGQAGAATAVHRFPWKSVQFSGVSVTTGTFVTSGGEFQLQGSNDNANWVDLGDAVTLDGFVALDTYCHFLRVLTNSHTAGTPVATLAGLEPI